MLRTLAFLFVMFAAAMAAADDRKPTNFVVFLADDLGWGDLGCYGHERTKTPYLDAFAKQGVRFTQCYSASAFCSPSRSAILTGRTPYRNGVFTWLPEETPIHLRTSEITVARLLGDRGYATCHVGKWHLNGGMAMDQPQPSDHGYDWYMATQNNAAPNHLNPENFYRNGQPVGRLEGPSALVVAQEAINWLKNERKADQPFFIAVCTHEPHEPIESDPRFLKLYPDLEPDVAQHHANVTQMDHGFGMVTAALDELGLADDTFVIFTSDNGPEGLGNSRRQRGSTGGLRGRKRDVYEGGIRVPGIVRWPGHVAPNTTSDVPVVGSDIFATVCGIAGVPLPSDRTIDGADMRPALAGQAIERRVPLFWRCNIPLDGIMEMALRQGDWKLIVNNDLTRFELYNIKEDAQETRDRSMTEPAKMSEIVRAFWETYRGIEAESYDWPEVAPWEWNVRLQRAMQGAAPRRADARRE